MDIKRTEATRYLSVAALLDRSFRDSAIEQLIDEKHRAVAPSVGVDLVTVAKHCLNARRSEFKQDLILSLLAIPFFAAALALAGSSDPTPALLIVLTSAVLCGFINIFRADWNLRRSILRHFMRENFDPDRKDLLLNAEESRALAELEQWQNQNVVVYSGFQPFVGSGNEFGSWSFALDLRKGKEDLGTVLVPSPVSVAEIYAYLDKSLADLNLEKLVVEDKLYVNGPDIRNDKRFLSSPLARPFPRISADTIERTLGKPLQIARHYKCIRIVDWSGDLVLSVFVGIARISDTLSVTARYFLLTPIADKYRVVDTWNRTPSWRDWVQCGLTSLITSPFHFAFVPLILLSRLSKKIKKHRAIKALEKRILENPMFDYGAGSSLRESASAWAYRRYFQKMDTDMYHVILERQLLDKIVDFFDSRNIDTSDLKERRTTILNSGVLMSGGTIQAQSVAVGKEAKSLVGRFVSTGRAEKQAA